MMFRWINKQPGMQKFWNWCSHYQEIYDWISTFNKQSDLPFILTQQSIGENEYGKSGHLSIITLLKHLMMLLKYKFSGLHLYTLSKTLIACRDMQLRFFKVKTLLNNALTLIRLGGHDGPPLDISRDYSATREALAATLYDNFLSSFPHILTPNLWRPGVRFRSYVTLCTCTSDR